MRGPTIAVGTACHLVRMLLVDAARLIALDRQMSWLQWCEAVHSAGSDWGASAACKALSEHLQ